MFKDKKYRLLNVSVLIIVIFSSLINFFISAIFQSMSSSLLLFEMYINSGNSLFLPFLPDINLFCFLPFDRQIPTLSIGKLSDIIILINLIFAVQSGIYHSIKRIFTKEEFDVVEDSKLIESPIIIIISLSPNKPEKANEINDNIHSYLNNDLCKKSKSEFYRNMKSFYNYRIKRRKHIVLFKSSFFQKKIYRIINSLFKYILFFFFYPLFLVFCSYSLPFEITHSYNNITFNNNSRIRLEESAMFFKNYNIKNKARLK